MPTLVSNHEDMNRLLQSMGFDQVFNIVSESTPTCEELQDLPAQMLSEDKVKHKVLEAHRILMDLNDSNREAFRDLVSALEKSDS